MSAPLLVLAAGGTGGHMFPAQALAEEMVSIGWRVKLSTDKRGHVTPKTFHQKLSFRLLNLQPFQEALF